MRKHYIKYRVASFIFSKIPLSILVKLAGINLMIPYYHMVSDDVKIHIKHLYAHKSVKMFEKDIDFLARKFSPISLYDLLDLLRAKNPIPKKCFLLTFDDGFSEMQNIVAPILIRKGIPATFFINSAFIDNKELCYLNKASLIVDKFQKSQSSSLESKLSGMLHSHGIEFDDIESGILSIKYQQRGLLDEISNVINIDFSEYLLVHKPYLTSKQINKLIESGFTIGAHSIDHPLYSLLSLEDQIHQTIESVKFIREQFHLNYGVFAFPHSDHMVSKEFFTRLSNSGLIDLSFGTAGMIGDSAPNNLQRFSLEKPLFKAERIIAYRCASKLFKKYTGTNLITRQ